MGGKESICHCDSQCQKVAIASLSVNGLKMPQKCTYTLCYDQSMREI